MGFESYFLIGSLGLLKATSFSVAFFIATAESVVFRGIEDFGEEGNAKLLAGFKVMGSRPSFARIATTP